MMSASPTGSAWEGLDPWEKAAQWLDTAPEFADEIRDLARQHAQDKRMMDKHRMQMELDAAAHSRLMQTRLWWTQMLIALLSMINVAVLSAVAWHYADTGNVVPGLTLFGAGAGVTAGIYATGRTLAEKVQPASSPAGA